MSGLVGSRASGRVCKVGRGGGGHGGRWWVGVAGVGTEDVGRWGMWVDGRGGVRWGALGCGELRWGWSGWVDGRGEGGWVRHAGVKSAASGPERSVVLALGGEEALAQVVEVKRPDLGEAIEVRALPAIAGILLVVGPVAHPWQHLVGAGGSELQGAISTYNLTMHPGQTLGAHALVMHSRKDFTRSIF